MGLPYNPAIPCLGIYPKDLKAGTHTDICTLLFTVALSQQLRGSNLSGHQWVNKQNVAYTYNGIVLLFSHVWLFATPWTTLCQASLSFIIFQSLLKLMSIESVTPSNHLILCRLLLLPSVFPSIKVFSNELVFCIGWPKYWCFSIRPSNEYSGLTSFRVDCFDLLAVQGTLRSLLQHDSILNRKEILTPVAAWANLEDVMLSEIKSLKATVPPHCLELSNSSKQKVECCLPTAGEGDNGKMLFNECRVSVLQMKKFRRLVA